MCSCGLSPDGFPRPLGETGVWNMAWQNPESRESERISGCLDMLNLTEKETEAHRGNDLLEATQQV